MIVGVRAVLEMTNGVGSGTKVKHGQRVELRQSERRIEAMSSKGDQRGASVKHAGTVQ